MKNKKNYEKYYLIPFIDNDIEDNIFKYVIVTLIKVSFKVEYLFNTTLEILNNLNKKKSKELYKYIRIYKSIILINHYKNRV